MGLILTRDAILEAQDRKTETVEVPEWGGAVVVSEMSGTDRDAYEAALFVDRAGKREVDMANVRARLAALCIVDEAGNRLFTDADVMVLGRKSATALDRVASVAQRLNGMGARAVEDEVKN